MHSQLKKFEFQDSVGLPTPAQHRRHTDILSPLGGLLARVPPGVPTVTLGPNMYETRANQWVPQPIDRVFAFFSEARNLENLTPPLLRFHIIRAPSQMEAGARVEYKLRIRGFPVRWTTIIERWEPPHLFVDIQAKGPYKIWHHTHRFVEENGGTRIEDHVRYELPLGMLGRAVHVLLVKRDVEQIFAYRQAKIREIFG